MGSDDESYATIRSQILVLDPLPTLDKLFTMTKLEETYKNHDFLR